MLNNKHFEVGETERKNDKHVLENKRMYQSIYYIMYKITNATYPVYIRHILGVPTFYISRIAFQIFEHLIKEILFETSKITMRHSVFLFFFQAQLK